jgi:hypothetical protein
VEPSDRGPGVLGLSIAIVWDKEARTELYHVGIYRDSAVMYIDAAGSAPMEAVGRDENVQTACREPAFRLGDMVFYCTRPAGHAGPHGHWPEEHRERGYPAGDDAGA